MQDSPMAHSWKRNAAFFIAGQFLSMFGSMLVSHAITWHITLQEQSGALIALFTCAAMLPMVLISPFAGVWADRHNRKYLVNISDAVIAVITFIIAIFYSYGVRNIWMLLAAVIARSIGQGIQQPAVSALIPQIVPREHLTRFNAIQSAAQSLTMFATPMVAGALLTFLPIEHIFFIDVITAGIGIATVFVFVKVLDTAGAKEYSKGIKVLYREMMEGLRFIGEQPWLKILLIASALFGILASPSAMLTQLQVARTFGEQVWRLTAIQLAFSIGMMAGGVAIAAWGGFKNKTHTMVLAWLLFGVSTTLFGVIPNFRVYLGVMVFCGCTMPLYNTPAMTLMQTNIPPHLIGRVFSVLMVLNGFAMPLGITLFGPLGDAVRIEWLLIVTGVLLVVGGFILYGRKELISIGEEPIQPGTEERQSNEQDL